MSLTDLKRQPATTVPFLPVSLNSLSRDSLCLFGSVSSVTALFGCSLLDAVQGHYFQTMSLKSSSNIKVRKNKYNVKCFKQYQSQKLIRSIQRCCLMHIEDLFNTNRCFKLFALLVWDSYQGHDMAKLVKPLRKVTLRPDMTLMMPIERSCPVMQSLKRFKLLLD